MKALSPKQKSILDFLSRFFEEKERPPTIREIVKECELSSTSVADYNLNILEREGYIRRDPEVSRGIQILQGGQERRRIALVPLIGRIAAGEPIPVPTSEVWDPAASAETVEVPQGFLHGKEGVYALEVKGTSMVDALIGDGDIVLMQQASTAENGEMVAAWLKEEKEATLKKFYRGRGRIRLQPANPQFKPIYLAPEQVEIQGKVVGVIRKVG